MICPLCRSTATEDIYRDDEARFSHENIAFPLQLEGCADCGFVFQASAYNEAYDSVGQKIYRSFTKSNIFPFPNRSAENMDSLELILSQLQGVTKINILEIGANRGDFLYLLKEKIPSANIIGIDPAHYESCPVPILRMFFQPEIFSRSFDLIVLQHVLEHIKNLGALIRDICKVLKKDGLLYIEVPDLHLSLKHKVDDFIPEHINYFHLPTLSRLLADFSILSCRRKNF